MSLRLWLVIECATNALGFFGVALILYGAVQFVAGLSQLATGFSLQPIDTYVTLFSNGLTMIGVITTAASVYLTPVTRAPDRFSTRLSAPVVLSSSIFALGLMLFFELPPALVNGFACVGFAGALFRLIPVSSGIPDPQ